MSENLKQTPASFLYELQWNGNKFGFSKVSGLKRKTDIINHREGGDLSTSKRKLPGLRKTVDITLKRGALLSSAGSRDSLRGILDPVAGKDSTKAAATITMFDEKHQPVQTWVLSNAVVAKIISADLKADANEVAIEELELTHEGLSGSKDDE